MRRLVSIFFGQDGGIDFFLAFLVLTTIFVPMVVLSQLGRVALSVIFVIALISGAFATIQHRVAIYLVIALAISTLAADLTSEFVPARSSATLENGA
jgi:hypothetical protein